MKTIIIGAGASGVYLSILLKKRFHEEMDVLVLEQNSSSLKKLLATGNGRCNLSNQKMSIDYYQSDNQEIISSIISSFDMKEEMEKIGLLCQYQNQLLYPKSEQALSVKKVMMEEAQRLGVVFIYEQEVLSVSYQNQYTIHCQNQKYHSDYIVFAMGSEAGKLSGIKSTRYDILKKMGLHVLPVQPALVQMNTKPVLKQLKGVRVKGTFSLYEGQKIIHQEKGELLFTDYGVSGIAVMQLSVYIKENHHYHLEIDLFDDQSDEQFQRYIDSRLKKHYDCFYDGLIHTKLAGYFEKQSLKTSKDIVQQLKHMTLSITGLRSYETAQVMKGGLSLQEVNKELELKKYSHAYAIGEILNVIGMCGGYNLHFALSSAKRVAQSIERTYYVKNS